MSAGPSPPAPAACTLGAGEFRRRLAWIAALNRDALRGHRRRGLRLELTYDRAALARVREMVARERRCCASLGFHLTAESDAIRLVVDAPEAAHDEPDAVFAPFLTGAADACGGPAG